ncbi:MAG TPA: hypothetical protein VGH19_18730 [Verrucomicrobiae bacterium]
MKLSTIRITKFASCVAFLGVFLAMAPIHAQVDPAQVAAEEAAKRQATLTLLEETLKRAAALQKEGNLADAASLYEECLKLVHRLGGTDVDAQKRQALAGLTTTRLGIARKHFENQEFVEADKQASELLKFDPQNSQAKEFKAYNAEVAAKTRPFMPSKETLAKVPVVKAEKEEVSIMVQDAKLLYELRRLEEAEAKLREAIKRDPANHAAFYYLNLIQEARYSDMARKRDYEQRVRIVDVERAWEIPTSRDALPVPNPYVRTNVAQTGTKNRQRVLAKLDQMVIKEVFFDGLPLSEVVRFLQEESVKQDPEKLGINFIINSNLDDQPSSRGAPAGLPGEFGGAPGLDPLGQPLAPLPAAPAEAVDLETMLVKINPPLKNLRMIDALDAITKVATPIAGRGLSFMVEDYAVVFRQRVVDPPQMFTRIFKIDPNTFRQGLESVTGLTVDTLSSSGGGGGGGGGGRGGGGGGRGGGGGGQGGGQGGQNGGADPLAIPRVAVTTGGQGGQGGQGGGGQAGGGLGGQGGAGGAGGQGGAGITGVTTIVLTEQIQALARQFFAAAGVNLASNAAGGASTQIFFNDRTGVLMVRASLQDLEIIQSAIEVLNIIPPQVQVEAKFAEVTQNDTRGLGFDWFLGPTLIGSGRVVAQPGTQPTLTGAPSTANPTGTFPGNPLFGTATAPSATDGFLTGGLRQQIGIGSQQATIPTLASFTGILTDPQFKAVIRALEQRDGVDLLAAPRVTTVSGRQAQISVVDNVTLVSDVSLQQTGGQQTGGLVGGGTGAIGSTVTYTLANFPTGPVLDVIPYVSADGYTIQMTVIPTITEFIGYDNPGGFIPQAQSVGGATVGIPLTALLPLPRTRQRVVVTSTVVWDGQTMVLGGLISEDVRNVKDKVPVLGDLPFLGKLFRSESKSTSKKNLIIFVTPTIIDPSGNRVNSDREMPFARNSVPPQPAWSVRDKNYQY